MSQSVRKGRREKTERKRMKKIEEEPKGKKKTTKKTDEKEKMKEEKEAAMKNEALDFYRQLGEHDFKTFEGASIDFHRKREPVVFIPGENPVITAVKKEALLKFLMANNVHRVLIDALFPSRVPLLQSLLEQGIEVYVLRRPSALAGFKTMLLRRYDIQIPRKNDVIDAVAQAFTWPKFHRRLDWRFLGCWRAMNKWRRSCRLYYKVQQMLSEDKDESPVVTLHEDRLIEKAREFVDAVEMHYPKLRQVFEEVEIPDDDVIAQALCCEIALETYHIEKVSDVLRKAGIGIQSVPKKVRRKKREEVEKTEDKQTENKPKRKVFQYDGKLLFAANQLTIRLFHIDLKREPEKVMLRTKKLLEEIWRCSRRYIRATEEMTNDGESGRVGEALGVSGPSLLREGSSLKRPATGLGPLRKQGSTL